MKYPLVSIITPSYNQGDYIEETIQSVINQTYPYIEYIILDAESTDNTLLILDKYENNPRVSKIVREKDNGQADAIEKGFRMAKGEIVGWINSDDVLAQDVVEKSVKVFKENECVGLTYGDIVFIDDAGKKIKIKKAYPAISNDYLLKTDYDVYQPGSFYKRSVVEAAGYLDTNLSFAMDLDLWLRIMNTHDACHIGGVCAFFRWHASTKTVNGGLSFLGEIYRILHRHHAPFCARTKRRIAWYALKVIGKRLATKGRL